MHKGRSVFKGQLALSTLSQRRLFKKSLQRLGQGLFSKSLFTVPRSTQKPDSRGTSHHTDPWGVQRGSTAGRGAAGERRGGCSASLTTTPVHPAQNLMNIFYEHFFRLYVDKMVSGTMIKRNMYMEVCACGSTFQLCPEKANEK